ncbi:auxilin-like clathrin-binding protein required for normal clathrin function [Rhizina undulata]
MNDLSELTRGPANSTNTAKSNSTSPANYYNSTTFLQPAIPKPSTPSNAFANLSLRGSPLSSRTTSPSPANFNNVGAKPSTDSFSNLVSFGRPKSSTANLSLQEQQRLREKQRIKEEEDNRRKMDALFGASTTDGANPNAQFWDSLSGGPGGKEVRQEKVRDQEEDDLLAAFNSQVPVDNSSFYPPPTFSSPERVPVSQPKTGTSSSSHLQDFITAPFKAQKSQQALDPFDLEFLPSRDASPFQNNNNQQNIQDDDILGDLAKPVSELPPRPQPEFSPPPAAAPPKPAESTVNRRGSPPQQNDPRDPAIAEIVDMGFTVAQAKRALAETDTGLDVEAAVGWLLEEAHRTSRSASKNSRVEDTSERRNWQEEGSSRRRRDESGSRTRPIWDKERGADGGEKDLSTIAQEIGGNLFKSANKLWDTGRKKVGKAIAELHDDSGVPKWMRDQQELGNRPRREPRGRRFEDEDEHMRPPRQAPQEPALTDEALMLEAASGPPRRKHKEHEDSRPTPSASFGLSEEERIQMKRQHALENAIHEKERVLHERDHHPHHLHQPETPRHTPAIPTSVDRKSKLARESADGESATQYVSRNRRRPPPASSTNSSKPNTQPGTPEPSEDLISPHQQSRNPFFQPAQQRSPPQQAPPPRPKPTPKPKFQRHVIPISPAALQSSNSNRAAGSSAFKRGDYTSALDSYSASISPLPEQHPLRILLLNNRAITNLKLGDAKKALADCDMALEIIGETCGEDEDIDPLDGTEKKPMKDFWMKAMTRKAEALEHLERFAEAGTTWGAIISRGLGGSIALAGRRRCESALKPASAPPPRVRPSAAPPSRKATPVKKEDAAAVTALREANKKADQVDAEKIALYDKVEERVNAWKHGKESNLRALLASLDTVLWEGAGWKKVGLGELVVPGKCKVVYMKGIAKCHPDKISTDATTEQRMLSAAVFSTLNEAWDKFKTENGL